MSALFLLLEVVDPEVSAFLWSIRDIVSGRQQRPRAPIHLTVRGPYDSTAPRPPIDAWRRLLSQDVLAIEGVGRFSNQRRGQGLTAREEVVFFRVDSPHLRDVWWKPDFHNFEPHISVYRGNDEELADRLAAFLSDERVRLVCAEHRLVWHETKQPNMFTNDVPTVSAMNFLANSGRIDMTILDRLRTMTYQYALAKNERMSTWPADQK